MKISDILRAKAVPSDSAVVTISPDSTVTELLAVLAEHHIGALVICRDDRVAGIVSERDIVRRLNERGADLLGVAVSEIMTSEVYSCGPHDDVDRIAETMTERRIRHMPVLDGDRMIGLVSIGDVVKSRIEQLEVDRGQLEQYITG
jgi:CBS domain-containing protein